MTNKEWLFSLPTEKLEEWMLPYAPFMNVGGKQELTKFGVVIGWNSSWGRVRQWLEEEK